MSTSSDIKSLFDRFDGDATTYREIGVENDARDARERWPLLGLIDPRRFEAGTGGSLSNDAQARPHASATQPAAGTAQSSQTQAELRRTAPLFVNSPRRGP